MVKPRTSAEFCVFFRSVEGFAALVLIDLNVWQPDTALGLGPCTILSLMSCSGLQLYSKNLVIVREWQE